MPLPTLPELFGRNRRSRFLSVLDIPHLILCILILGLNLALFTSGKLERLENQFFDFFLRQSPAHAADPEIVLIQIDKESLDSIGGWPWPWKYHAQMLEILKKWQAKTVVFDFPILGEDGENLEFLAAAFEGGPDVYLPLKLRPKAGKKIWVHGMPVVIEPENERKIWQRSAPELEKKARALGHLNLTADGDGILRRVTPFLAYSGESYFYLPLKIAADSHGKALENPLDMTFPMDSRGNVLLNWSAKAANAFYRVSYADVIQSDLSLNKGIRPVVDPTAIKGKICWIGLKAPEAAELKVTPLHPSSPEIEIHAQALDNALRGQFIEPVSKPFNTLALCLLGFTASILFVIFGNVASFVAALVMAGLWFAFSFYVFVEKGLWFATFHPLALLISLFISSAIYHQLRSKKENTRLFDLATRDGLTGLYVIRHFREILNRAVLDTMESGKPLSIILMDVDNFKKINDTYGHPAGDMVLKKIAQILVHSFRVKRPVHQIDFAARYGGEEFIVMLRNANLKDAGLKVAERIRKTVEDTVFEWEGTRLQVTISLGTSSLHPGETIPDLMVRRADDALYRAKKTGKNRVCLETFASK